MWSCLTFVSCVIENSLRVLVQANRSCCIAPWIQLRVGGAQMTVFLCVFCAGWPAVGCGVACSEVKLSAQTHSSSRSCSGLSTSNNFANFCATDELLWPYIAYLHVCTLWPVTSSALCLMDTVVAPFNSLPPLLHPFYCFLFFSWKVVLLLFFLSLCFPNESNVLLTCAIYQLLHQT